MSADQATATSPSAVSDKPLGWADRLLELEAQCAVGAAGIALDRRKKNSDMAYALSEFAATADQETLAKRMAAIATDQDAEGNDMGVSVGNTYTINYPAPPAASTDQSSPPPVVAPATAPSAGAAIPQQVFSLAAAPGWLKALILAGALGASGIGGYVLNQAISSGQQIINQGSPYDIGGAVTPLPVSQ